MESMVMDRQPSMLGRMMTKELGDPLLERMTSTESAYILERSQFSQAELDGIHAALKAVEGVQQSLAATDGLSQMSFFLGVVNVPLICFVFAWYPEHFFMLYALEALVLIPVWWVTVTRVYRGALWVLDFCWAVNIGYSLYMLLLALDLIPAGLRHHGFLSFYATALGPLGWAALALHNGLIFHSIEKITSLFIHTMPTLVVWTVSRHPGQLAAAWPDRFPTEQELKETSLAEFYSRGIFVYSVWLLLHGAWLLTVGVDAPSKGQSTVFAELHASTLGPLLTSLTKSDNIRLHAAMYLLMHFIACSLVFVFATLCFKLPRVHAGFALILFLSAAWNGAGYYEYVMAKKYTKVVRKVFEERDAPPSARPPVGM